MIKELWAAFIRMQERRAAILVLSRFSDRELRDLGITRGEILSRVNGPTTYSEDSCLTKTQKSASSTIKNTILSGIRGIKNAIKKTSLKIKDAIEKIGVRIKHLFRANAAGSSIQQ